MLDFDDTVLSKIFNPLFFFKCHFIVWRITIIFDGVTPNSVTPSNTLMFSNIFFM